MPFLPLLLALLLLAGCAAGSAAGRRDTAAGIARQGGLARLSLPTGPFVLAAALRVAQPGAKLRIYIEGDGAAWIDRSWRSADPTPRNPVALVLAAKDPATNVAWLGRPGQYLPAEAPGCDPAYWSDRRYAPEVLAAMGAAVGELAARAAARRIELVGYSGGAAIALLVAAGRTDVAALRTVAGNLDPAALNRHHGVSPPAGDSLDPGAAGLAGLPQRHFVGARDDVVPPALARGFLARMGDPAGRSLTVVAGVSHAHGWAGRWRELLELPLVSTQDRDETKGDASPGGAERRGVGRE